jgi:hypothetical protein
MLFCYFILVTLLTIQCNVSILIVVELLNLASAASVTIPSCLSSLVRFKNVCDMLKNESNVVCHRNQDCKSDASIASASREHLKREEPSISSLQSYLDKLVSTMRVLREGSCDKIHSKT